jgi:hypothetical protein
LIQENRIEDNYDCGCRREGGRKAMINAGEEKGRKSRLWGREEERKP